MGLPPPSSEEGGELCPSHPSAQHTPKLWICGFTFFYLDLTVRNTFDMVTRYTPR